MRGLFNNPARPDEDEEQRKLAALKQGLLRGGLSEEMFDEQSGGAPTPGTISSNAQHQPSGLLAGLSGPQPMQGDPVQESGLLGQQEVAPRADGQGFELLKGVDAASAENQAMAAGEGKEGINSQKGVKDKTPFDDLDKDAKFAMQQLMQAVPLLKNMDDADFAMKAPQFVLELKKMNPFLAKMIPSGGITKEDLAAITEGVTGLTKQSRASGKSQFKLQDVILPDGTRVIGRLNEGTGEVFVPDKNNKFVPAPFGTNLKGDDAKKEGGLTASQKSAQEKKIIELKASKSQLESLGLKYDDDFLKFGGQLRAKGAAVRDKVGGILALNAKDKDFLAKKAAFTREVESYFNVYKKFVSGATVGEKEMKDLVKSITSMKDSPVEFKAKYESIIDRINADTDREMEILQIGLAQEDPKENIRKLANGEEVPFNASDEEVRLLNSIYKDETISKVFPLEMTKAVKEATADKGADLDEEDLAILEGMVMKNIQKQIDKQNQGDQ